MKATRPFRATVGLDSFLALLWTILQGWWQFGLPPIMNLANRNYLRFRLEVLWQYGLKVHWEHTSHTFGIVEYDLAATRTECPILQAMLNAIREGEHVQVP